MIITRKHLSRRTFLRGAGVAVGLPLLESMIPASTALGQTVANPRIRLGFLYMPHGAMMSNWTPATEGTDFELSRILSPLKEVKNQVVVVSASFDLYVVRTDGTAVVRLTRNVDASSADWR